MTGLPATSQRKAPVQLIGSGTRGQASLADAAAVLIGAAAIVVATWASTAWLLAEADKAITDKKAGLRIDAIRTGLSVGAGTGGAFALLLAVRRHQQRKESDPIRSQGLRIARLPIDDTQRVVDRA